MTTKYIAVIGAFATVELTKVEVQKQTRQFVTISKIHQRLIGYTLFNLNRRTKINFEIFDTKFQAIGYLIKELNACLNMPYYQTKKYQIGLELDRLKMMQIELKFEDGGSMKNITEDNEHTVKLPDCLLP